MSERNKLLLFSSRPASQPKRERDAKQLIRAELQITGRLKHSSRHTTAAAAAADKHQEVWTRNSGRRCSSLRSLVRAALTWRRRRRRWIARCAPINHCKKVSLQFGRSLAGKLPSLSDRFNSISISIRASVRLALAVFASAAESRGLKLLFERASERKRKNNCWP